MRDRKIFHPMIHFPSDRNSWSWVNLKPGARSLLWVSHTGAGSQSFGPSSSSTVFPGHRQGAGWEVGLPGLEPAPIWDPGRARRGLNHCATAPGPTESFLMVVKLHWGHQLHTALMKTQFSHFASSVHRTHCIAMNLVEHPSKSNIDAT